MMDAMAEYTIAPIRRDRGYEVIQAYSFDIADGYLLAKAVSGLSFKKGKNFARRVLPNKPLQSINSTYAVICKLKLGCMRIMIWWSR